VIFVTELVSVGELATLMPVSVFIATVLIRGVLTCSLFLPAGLARL
jgi:hypothetical protein